MKAKSANKKSSRQYNLSSPYEKAIRHDTSEKFEDQASLQSDESDVEDDDEVSLPLFLPNFNVNSFRSCPIWKMMKRNMFTTTSMIQEVMLSFLLLILLCKS